MKSMKRIVSGILAAVMAASAATFVSAADVTFTDRFHEDGTLHWAWERGYIPYLVEKKVLNGYEQDDGTFMFKPEDKVTRAEFIKMLDETFGLTDEANISTMYGDVTEGDWFYKYFAKAVEQGYLLNYGEKADPNGELTREEATALLVRYLDLPAGEKVAESKFADYDSIHPGFKEYVLMAAKAEVINGYEENDGTFTFRPKNPLTRAEALTILYRAAGAIFTENTDAADEAAFEKNAVVKNGGITLSNQNLNGRVIVGEGADKGTVAFYRSKVNDTLYIRGGANIVFDAATVNTVVVDSKDIINITVQAETVIDHLIINEHTNVTLGSGTIVKKLTVAEGAQHTTLSGTGKVQMAEINAADVSAAMVPEAYEIAKGLTAVFASKNYKGSSATAQAFASTPYVSLLGNYHFINMTAVTNGAVRYYFTNTADAPDTEAFEALYKAAKYGNVLNNIRANKAEEKTTYSYSQIKDFAYVVLQMTADDGTAYDPIVISNEIAEGTGFTTDPYLKNSTTAAFTTKAAGTVYYMYTTSANAMTAAGFLDAYEDQTAALKGETTDRNGEIDVNSRYSDVNRYMAFMYKSESGVCYTPVVVSLGDTGFYFDPELESDGVVSGVPSIDGIMYYYYSETATLPTPDKFGTTWRSAIYSGSELSSKGSPLSVFVRDDIPSKYKYMIVCIRDEKGNYYTPIALKLEGENGFSSLPEVSDDGKILFKPSESGMVYYYYAKDSTVPDVKTFDDNYNASSIEYRGFTSVDAGYTTVSFDAKKAATHPYLVFMLEGDAGTSYLPVVCSLTSAKGTGFSTEPYIINSSTIGFKTNYDCEVWWYYARLPETITAENFEGKWRQAFHGDFMAAEAGKLETVTINQSILESFPYIVFATSEGFIGVAYTTPVMLHLQGSQGSVDDTGFRVTAVSKYDITLTSFETGKIYYYETNSSTVPTKLGFDDEFTSTASAYQGSVSVSAGEKGVSLSVSGSRRYVVLQLENYDINNKRVYYNVVQVDLTKGSTSGSTSDPTVTPDPDAAKYGFILKEVDVRNNKVIIIPEYTGTLSFSIGDESKMYVFDTQTVNAVKGQALEINYPSITSVAGMQLYFHLSFTGSNGYKFTDYPALILLTLN